MGVGAFCLCLNPGGRPDFVRRVSQCFLSQTYIDRSLLVFDSAFPLPIGTLRNRAIDTAVDFSKLGVIAHFDWDDWSAPERLSEQVSFMEHTGADVVGYCDMPFYDAVHDKVYFYDSRVKSYTLGTALFYKREVWEKVPFPDVTPEDTTWQHSLARAGFTICSESSIRDRKVRMIQTLHGGNASAHLTKAAFEPAEPWLDQEVRRILEEAETKIPA